MKNEGAVAHQESEAPDSVGQRPPETPSRELLTNAAAVKMVFARAHPDDFYPLFVEQPDTGDGGGFRSFRAITHNETARHTEWIDSAGERKTYWNLCSYRPSAIRASGNFTWKKDFVRGVHGVFIDFDCGRKPGEEKCDEPGATLTQDQVWKGVEELIHEQVLPPFQMWADGTRGCYGLILFEEPENAFEAAEKWTELRGYFHRRAKHLAADELARAITQPLKAPGACGVVRYYSTGAPCTSMMKLIEWFKAHPHPSDLSDIASRKHPLTAGQQLRLSEACTKLERHTSPRVSSGRRTMSWQQKVGWVKARMDDMETYVRTFRRTGYSRRKFFLDLASAVKLYEYGRDEDSHRAYRVALEFCSRLNDLIDRPLSPSQLKAQVQSADPTKRHRSSEAIRIDMGITESIAYRLGLRALLPASMKMEAIVRSREERAQKAEERAAIREARQKEKEAAKSRRMLELECERESARAERTEVKANPVKAERERRTELVEGMLRKGRPTTEIASATGVHRQQIGRIKKRLIAAGADLPKQEVLKRGRKRNTSH